MIAFLFGRFQRFFQRFETFFQNFHFVFVGDRALQRLKTNHPAFVLISFDLRRRPASACRSFEKLLRVRDPFATIVESDEELRNSPDLFHVRWRI